MLLEGSNLAFRYGHRGGGKTPWLFQRVNLSVAEGEIVGLVGPSGCGKSTLGRLLAGYERPHEGAVTLGGAPLPASGYHPVQLVFQHPEKAVNPRWPMRRILHEGWEPDDELLASLGIEPGWLGRFPGELSGGELQRFCVARALSPRTRFLIADEMTTMLDAITQAQIWRAVLDIADKRRVGVLVISHERHLIERLCTRVVEFSSFFS